MDQDNPKTLRPPHKRVRSTEEHVDPENTAQPLRQSEGMKDGKVPEWLSKPPFQYNQSWDGWDRKWRCSCWCGKTAFSFSGDPLAVKACHCDDCQRLHGSPFQLAAIFKKDEVRLDGSPDWLGFLSAHGDENGDIHPLASTPTPLPHKISCRACGSPMFDQGRNMMIGFPPTFDFPRTRKEAQTEHEEHHPNEDNHGKKTKDDHSAEHARGRGIKGLPKALQPQCHIFYERRTMDVPDKLPKWRKHMGESEQMGDYDE